MDLAESKVKIRQKPLLAKYFTPINDTVCYDYTATLSATSSIGYPQYFEWFKNDAQTLLHRDTAFTASDMAKFNPEHQITDSLYYVHVYNDTTCPYLPDRHKTDQFVEVREATLLNQLIATTDTVDIVCGEMYPFYDNGGKNGNTTGTNYQYYSKVFRAESGKQVVLHIDTLSVYNSTSYALRIYDGITTSKQIAVLYGSGIHDTTFTSTKGALLVRFYNLNNFKGWEASVTTDCDTGTYLAETTVSIRRPLAAEYVTPKNDTVCYDNTATLSATSPIGFPQYYEWFKDDAVTLLKRDTVNNATEYSDYIAEHQIKDSLYYVHVYNDITCPYLPDLYRTEQFIETRPATLLNQMDATPDTVDIVCGEIYPFYDNGGKNGNMTGTYQYYRKVFRAELGKQVILHIDTLSVINNASYPLRIYDGTTTSKQIAVLYGPGIHDTTFTSTTGALTVRLNNYLGYMGWEASVKADCDTANYLAETTVSIRRPLAAEYVTPKNDTVCYDNTATLSATSAIGFPQYFSWWKDDAVTLLKRDTLNDATELSDYIAEHQIKDSLYYVHVYNDTTCPYLPEVHLDFRTLRGETILDQPDATPDTMNLVCGDLYAFYDNGGKNGNAIGTDGTYYKKVFRAEPGKQVILHIDTLSVYNSASYALRIYDGTKNSTASQIAVLYGSSIHDTTFTSTTGALTVRFRKYNNYMGWEGTVTTDCNDILAEANVSIRKPLTADYITPKNDTVCYDYTATVTATSSIGFPQYFSWWKDDAVTLLKRDTLNDATELSDYIAEHQIKDSIYYVHVYSDTTCPYLPEVHSEKGIVGQTLLNQATADTVDIACGEMYNFYDKGGKNGNTTNSYTYYRKVFRAEPGHQVVLHIDTLSLYNDSYYGLRVYDGATTSNQITDLFGSGVHDITITSTKGALFVTYYEYGSHMGWEGTVTTDCHELLAVADVKIRKPLGTTAVITTNDTVCYDYTATLTATSPSAVYPQYFSWWKDDGHTLLHRDTVNNATEHSDFVTEHQVKDSLYYVVVEDSTSCPFRLDVYPIKPIEQPALSVYEQPDSTVVHVHKGERIPLRNLATSVDGAEHNIIFEADEGEKVVMNVTRLYNPNTDYKEVGVIYDVISDGASSERTGLYADSYYGFTGTGEITSYTNRLALRTLAEASVDDVWDGYVTSSGTMFDVAEAKVSIRKPLGKESVLATHDTVCYDHTATLTATSPVGYPQYFSWWKNDGQTLLHRDTLHNDTEHSEFMAEHQITDSLYYVVVENDTSCPFRTDVYHASFMSQPEVSIYGVSNDSVIHVNAGESIPLRNNVLPGSGEGTARAIFFETEKGQTLRLHVDSLYDPSTYHYDFGYVYAVNDDGSFSFIDYLFYDEQYYPLDVVSNTGRMLLFKYPYSPIDDRLVAYVTAGDLFDAAESKVTIRKPINGKTNALTSNDTVCYDNTAMLTATSALTYPQYYNWWDKSMSTLLMSDTVLAAGDVSTWMPTHQTQDSLYYVTVYDQNTCPLVPGVHNIKEPTPRHPEVLLDPYNTNFSIEVYPGDTIPFQILDTLIGTSRNYSMHFVNKSESEGWVLHIDTIGVVTGIYDYASGNVYNSDDSHWDPVFDFYVDYGNAYTYSNRDIVLPYNKSLDLYMYGCCDTVSVLIKGYVTVPAEVRYQMAESHVKVIPVPATVTTTDVTFCPNAADTLLTAVFTDVTPTYTAVWMSEGDTLAVHKDIPDTQLTDTIHFTAPAGTMCGDVMKYNVICVASTGCETVSDTSLITYAVTEGFTVPSGKDSVVACMAKALAPAASQLPTVTDGCGNVLTPTGPVSADSIPTSCEGKRTYTYTYTDCATRSHEWTYTYWIRMPEQMAGIPANDTVEVNTVAEATAPGAPDIADECGRTISPLYDPATDSVSTIGADGTGTIEHTYHYSDCAGHDSTYTRVYRLSTISTPLTIASGDCVKEYNGLEQTCEEYTVTFGGVTVDECMACRTRGGYTHRYILPTTGDTVTIKDAIVVRDVVTDTANTYTAIIGHASRYLNVTLDTGKFTITPIAIEITASDSTKECDGTPLVCDRWSLTSGTLGDGDTITSVTVTGVQDGVGSSANTASGAKIEKGTEDVTHNYTIAYKAGHLTVTDTTKPSFAVPSDTTLYKDATCSADTTASSAGVPSNLTDNCGDASTLTVTHSDGGYSSTCAGSYTFERVWRVTDATGNYTEKKQTVTVSDTTSPEFKVPDDTTLYVGADCTADTTPSGAGEPTVLADNCTSPSEFTVTHTDAVTPGTCGGAMTVERTWRVADACGNYTEKKQTITVEDTTGATFEAPADTVICREVATAMVVNPDASVTGRPSGYADNCTDAAALEASTTYTDVNPVTVDHNAVNYIERHWKVTDACGNETEKVQRIGVFPAIHDGNTTMQCHDTALTLAYGRCDTVMSLREPTWSTEVTGSPVRLSNDAPSGNRFAEGTTVVTWTLTDTCGFTVTCQQTVVVSYPPCGRPEDTVVYDGFTYHTVRVGCECWLQENLRNRVYSDGTDVAVYSSYEHSDQNEEDYGLLYTWYSAVRVPEGDNTAVPADSVAPMGEHYVEGACPAGWAVPTDAQYEDLWLNGYGASGLKDKDARYWLPGYAGTDPNSYFNARGAGYYDPVTDRYYNLLGETYFWTGEPTTNYTEGHCAVITSECPELLSKEQPKGRGQSIRCVQKR